MKGATEAARKLTSALKKAERACRKDLAAAERRYASIREVQDILGKHFYRIVYPVMLAHSNVGAADTEPRTVAKDYLNKVANEYGFYGYLDF
jgi:hypothetical protein